MTLFKTKYIKPIGIVNKLFRLIGDKDLQNTALNHGFKLISGPLLVLLIPFFISNIVQGYWFSFISVSALSILADLGFTIIILQFSAHEFAFLRIENEIIVPLDKDLNIHLNKLAALLKFSLGWLKKIIFIAFPIILLIGIWLFHSKNNYVSWEVPWIIYTLGAALTFFNSVLLSLMEGCNNVSLTQRIRFYNSVIYFLILFPLLILHTNLFALAFAILISSILTLVIIYFKFKFVLKQLWNLSKEYSYDWTAEFWGFFKKYSFSVASGFIVVQIFTPLSFKYYGAIEAGKVGLTMSLSTAIFSIANVWFQAIAPKVNMLTSQKKWVTLNKLIIERLIMAIFTYVFIFLIFGLIFISLNQSAYSNIINRFLPAFGILIISLNWLIQLPMYTMAFYLRAHMKEPYLYLSILNAIGIVLLTFLTVNFLPYQYIFIGLLLTTIISFPFAYLIFRKKRIAWCI